MRQFSREVNNAKIVLFRMVSSTDIYPVNVKMAWKVPVAVIWSRPYCDYLIVKHPFVTLHHELMSPADGLYFISVIKCGGYIAAK